MAKVLKRVLFFISLLVLYLIIKELLVIIHYTRSVHPYLMYGTVAALLIALTYFILLPLLKIFSMSKIYSVTNDEKKVPSLLRKRIDNFRNNPYLNAIGYDFSTLEYTEEYYNEVTSVIAKQCHLIRKKYVLQIFLTTGISQNGFLDSFLILSGSFGMIKEIFVLYHGRVPDKEMLKIFQKVYYSMAIGGSGLVEFAVEEFVGGRLFSDVLKSIPFISKILSSLADGYVNAAIFTWVSMVAENYCRKIHVKNDRDLYPASSFFLRTFNNLASETLSLLKKRVVTKDETEGKGSYTPKRSFLHNLLKIKPQH
jgi:hypothetical protein